MDFANMPEPARLAMRAAVDADLNKSRTVHTAILALVVWEICCTLPMEYKVLWKAKWRTWTTVFYVINRYFLVVCIAVNLWLQRWSSTPDQCDKIVRWTNGSAIVTFTCGTILVVFRCWSICDRDIRVLGLLSALLVATITVQIITVASTTSNPIFSVLGLSACTPAMNGKYYVAFFALVIAQDCLAFLLSARSTISAYRNSKSDLTIVLLRDTAFWLAVCLTASLANIIYYAVAPASSNRALLSPLSTAFQSISASRLLLALRYAAYNGRTGTASLSHITTPPRSIALPSTPVTGTPLSPVSFPPSARLPPKEPWSTDKEEDW